MFPDAREVEELVARDGIFGFRLAVENRKACCEIRKVRPLKRALAGAAGWVTGLRREQSAGRGACSVRRMGRRATRLSSSTRSPTGALEQLEAYVAANNVPINPLHAQRLPVDRLPAVHARHQARRGHPRRPLVVGERGR